MPRVSGVFHIGDAAYDRFMGRYSVRLAPLFADFADVHGGRVLDVGAGTGALTAELLERGATVTAAEPSPEFCAEVRGLLEPYGDVLSAELEVTAPYSGFDDFWAALGSQVGPAGAWLAALDDEQQRRAREEMHRQLGSPGGPFTLSGICYAARVSTDARSAPVPTSVTSTSS